MALRRLLWLVPLLVGGALGSAQVQNTGWRSPSAHSGQFTNATQAYSDGGTFATSTNGQEHRYWGYGISIPAGNEIVGIEVRVDARRHTGPQSALYVELSWDGGVSWTTTGHFAGWMTSTTWREYVLGGAANTWGRTWIAGELADGGFRVRLQAAGASRLDWVAVRVYHRAVTLTLVVNPQLVDLGTLTLAHYDAGHRELSPAQRLTVSSAAGWSLYVAADAATWTYTGAEPPPGKPSSHLQWRVSASGPGVTGPQTSYLGLTTASQRVAGGTAGIGLWLDIALRVLVDYTFTVPGSYELRFTYTLTSP